MVVDPALLAEAVPRTNVSDDDAILLASSYAFYARWCRAHGLDRFSREAREVYDRGDALIEAREQRPPPPNPRRRDTELIFNYARKARLPLRQTQVFELCIRNGMSLTACAKRLGISRETVRVHLRLLRKQAREHAFLDQVRARPPIEAIADEDVTSQEIEEMTAWIRQQLGG